MLEYTWAPATGSDVNDIVEFAQQHFKSEIDTIFTFDAVTSARNMTFAVVSQFYMPATTLVMVARSTAGKIIAYTWAKTGERAPWSDDNMVSICMAHVDMTLNAKNRLRLLVDMFTMWEQFAVRTGTPIICSTTIRKDQAGFLRLHERYGYDVRGSYCYKRLPSRDSLQS
jgi:hypothetical protein